MNAEDTTQKESVASPSPAKEGEAGFADVEAPIKKKKKKKFSNEIAVDIQNVTIVYRSYNERPTSFKETVLRFFKTGKLRYFSTFAAVSDVTFSVRKGEIVGIIGSNGAGKSTLLKAISGVLPPSKGRVKVEGKLDSLISLGAGFDHDLNAIENIYLYGSLHQIAKEEIEKRIPKILEFAELKDFAYTPIKYYSSGMFARLGFACAIDTDPDVLIVDEVLAVGDERFNKKCRKRMEQLLASGKTILMVSHGVNNLVNLADNIALLSKGRLVFFGDPEEAARLYRSEDYQTALDGHRF
jgi:ABC-type polysaccharide/polyol phosphate transport system ATPase subunit